MKVRNTTNRIQNERTARENAILQNLDLVNRVARRFHQRVPPCVTFDDLSSAGIVGLIHAVDRFDESRGLKFKTYAQHRVWGAMQDFLRDEDPLSRTERTRIRGCDSGPVTVSLEQIHSCRVAATGSTNFAMHTELATARRCLSARENRLIELIFDLGWNSREVATDLGVNESRVSQIKNRALLKMRGALRTADSARAA